MSRPVQAEDILDDIYGTLSTEEEAELLQSLAFTATLATPVAPPPGLKDRVLAAADQPRYAFLDRVAKLIDLTLDQTRIMLDRIQDLSLWEDNGPGTLLLHVPGGPACAGAVVGFVRVEPDTRFPRHIHLGEETVLVLQGGLRTDSGLVCRAGDLAVQDAGSDHEFTSLPGEPLLYLVRVNEGVDFSPVGGGIVTPRY